MQSKLLEIILEILLYPNIDEAWKDRAMFFGHLGTTFHANLQVNLQEWMHMHKNVNQI
jgi:hypothetical protein